MKIKFVIIQLSLLALFTNCERKECCSPSYQEESVYFPPIDGSNVWETKSMSEINWNQSAEPALFSFLESKNTKAFIVLHNGKIVLEYYQNGHTQATPWYWASAGKTLTSATVGIAQQENILNINNKVATYLGTGWTTAPLAKENLITCKHLLTMTSGLDDEYNDSTDENLNDCVAPSCLVYKADAGTRWAYDNVYVKLQDVVAQASGQTWDNYFNAKLKSKIGMTGSWLSSGNNSVYWSTARSMARFGLLISANGTWNGTEIINSAYLNEAHTTSQTINLSYGYLWWLNGKASYHLPQSQAQFTGNLIPNAPSDMYCALGKNDQKIYIVPSKKLVIVRMGNSAEGSNFALSTFDNDLWQKINTVIQ